MADLDLNIRARDRTAAGVQSVNRRVGGLRDRIGGLANVAKTGGVALAGVATAAIAVGAQALNAAEQIQKVSLRTGVSTETLSKWRFAAEQAGSSLDVVEKGQRRFAGVIDDAERGLSTAVYSLDALGLSLDSLRASNPEQQMELLANAIAAVEDPTQRLALAQDVLGRAGAELIPFLAGGAEELRRLGDQAERTGNIVSTNTANAAAEAVDAINEMQHTVGGLATELVGELAPALTAAAGFVSDFIGGLRTVGHELRNVWDTAWDFVALRTTEGWRQVTDEQQNAGSALLDDLRQQLNLLTVEWQGYHGGVLDGTRETLRRVLETYSEIGAGLAAAAQLAHGARTTFRAGQQVIPGSGETVSTRGDPTRNIRFELAQLTRTNVATLRAIGGEGGGSVINAVESQTEEQRSRLDMQLETLYANNRLSQEQYDQLRDSTNLQDTLNQLTMSASEGELRALDQVRSTAFRVGEITAAGSRAIVTAIQSLREREEEERPRFARGRAIDTLDRTSRRQLHELGIPIRRLAQGGIVRSPTFALIGEGGRPERVSPLDSDRPTTINFVVDGRVLARGYISEVQRALDRGELTVRAS